MVLPSGLVVPPLPYLLALLVAGTAVVGTLYTRRPSVNQRFVIALAPWMVTGAGLHALFQLDAAPDPVAPLLSAPAVYVTTFVVAGGVWAASTTLRGRPPSRLVGVAGGVVAAAVVALVLGTGLARGTLSLLFPVAGFVVAVALAAVVHVVLVRWRPAIRDATGAVGGLVVFSHALDGVSTAIGVDLLGTGERSPIPRAIMDFAGTLPTAPVVGEGWLFVLVKIVVATAVLVAFVDYVREEPVQGNLGLALVAAVGLGPGAHNLLLFAVAA